MALYVIQLFMENDTQLFPAMSIHSVALPNPQTLKKACVYWFPIPELELYNLWQFSFMFMECTDMNGPVNRNLNFWGGCGFVLHLYPEPSTMEFKSVMKAFMCCGFENSNTTDDGNKPQRENLSQSAFRLEFPKPASHLIFPSSTPV